MSDTLASTAAPPASTFPVRDRLRRSLRCIERSDSSTSRPASGSATTHPHASSSISKNSAASFGVISMWGSADVGADVGVAGLLAMVSTGRILGLRTDTPTLAAGHRLGPSVDPQCEPAVLERIATHQR